MADSVTMHSLPVFLRLAGRPVILIGEGQAATAKRRLLDRAGASIVTEDEEATIAIIASDAPDEAAARLKARGVLVNVADRPDLCDFTLPAIVDRSPVIVAIGTGGASAGLAAALRQRLETILPARLGLLAERLQEARTSFRQRLPDGDARRRAIDRALSPGAALDLLEHGPLPVETVLVDALTADKVDARHIETIRLISFDPDDLTLRQARALGRADRVIHAADVPAAILNRARADAERIVSPGLSLEAGDGLTVYLEMAR